MKSIGKTLLLVAAAAAMTVASLSTASADDRWRHNGWGHNGGYHGGYRHDGWGRNGWGIGAGILGGAILGSALASEPRYYDDEYAPPPVEYYAPPRRVYYAPAPYARTYAGGLQPWSPSWVRYCEGRYRTFDGRTGTYVGNDGGRHFCVAS